MDPRLPPYSSSLTEMQFYRSYGVLRVEKEESYILALHGIAISCFYILLSILLRLAEWFAMTITGWGGLAEGFPWWIILPLIDIIKLLLSHSFHFFFDVLIEMAIVSPIWVTLFVKLVETQQRSSFRQLQLVLLEIIP